MISRPDPVTSAPLGSRAVGAPESPSPGRRTEVDEVVDRLASALAHQLGQSVTLIEGYRALLEEEEMDADPRERADAMAGIATGVERLRAVLEELVVFSHVATRPSRPGRVEPRSAVEDAARQLDALAPNSARVEVEALPAVRADPAQVNALFRHLLGHAVAANGSDGGVVRVTGQRAGELVTLTVSDEGDGLGAPALDELFELGTHLRGTGVMHGAGLAPAIARRIAEANGGRIDASSPQDGGVTVTVTLPAG